MSFWITDLKPVELRERDPDQDFNIIIRQAYKQVLGNAYLLEGEHLETAESLLRNGRSDHPWFRQSDRAIRTIPLFFL